MDGYNPYAPPTRDPTAPREGAAPNGQPQPWEIGEVLTVGINALKRDPLELIGGFFVAMLVGAVPGQLPNVLVWTGVLSQDSIIFYTLTGIMMIVGWLVGSYLWAGALRAALAAARQEPVDFALFFSGGDRMVALFIANFLVTLGATFGMLLLIVPGIVLFAGWSLASFLVVDADESPIEAIKASWELTQGHKMKIFLFGLTSFLLFVLGACACYVGIFAATPVVVIAFAEAYRRISGRMGGDAAAQGAVAVY